MQSRFRSCLPLLTGLLTAALMLMIFLFSSQTAEQSTGISTGILSRILDASLDRPLASMGIDMEFEALEYILRKIGHFTEFAMLGFCLCAHLHVVWHRIPWPWALAAGTLYAASDELHQLFSDGRSAMVTDVLIDGAGVLAGCGLFFLMCLLIRKYRSWH